MFNSLMRIWLLLALISWCASEVTLADDLFFDSNGAQLRYTDEGKGPVVLLVHGYSGNIENAWVKSGIVGQLIEAGYRVVALDCRGHGKSEKPKTIEAYGMPMVGDLVRILDHLEIQRAHVVGYSMGAAIVNKLRDQHADRMISVTLSGYGQPALPEVYSSELEEEVRKNLGLMNLLEGNDPKALALLSVKWREWLVPDAAMAKNRVPCLALIGADDVFLDDTKKLVDHMRNVQLEIVPGDHGNARSKPVFLKKLKVFLSSNSQATAIPR